MEQSKFYKIKNITEDKYTLVGCDGSETTRPIQEVDKTASVFTIQDAKEGDVLCYEDEMFILKNYVLFHKIVYHCCYDGENFIPHSIYSLTKDDFNKIHPTTKEQCDLLFQKMKEAGYEWNAEKKELKKIELKPAWSEEDEKLYTSALWHIKNSCGNGGKDSGEFEVYNWLKSLKDRVQLQQVVVEPKYPIEKAIYASVDCECLEAWGYTLEDLNNWFENRNKQESNFSEDDEKMLKKVISSIKISRSSCEEDDDVKDRYDAELDWLESLKPQNHWKPSEEQMEALFEAKLASTKNREYFLGLLYKDLKKL